VALENGGFNDHPAEDRAFWGVYAVHFWRHTGSGLDLYYLGLRREEVRYAQGMGRELRHTTGARLWGVTGNWDYDLEFAYQFGKFRGGDIGAWMAATNSGYTFHSRPLQPRLGLKIEVASGGRNLTNSSLQTFNPLFSNASLFNETDHIGLSNIVDLHPYLTLIPIKPIRWTFDWAFFWRQSTKDALYDNVVAIQRRGSKSNERYVGSALSTIISWQAARHWLLYGAYTHFFPGPFIRDTGPAETLQFFGLWATYRF
jgi:Alginate export